MQNTPIEIQSKELLSDNRFKLYKVTYESLQNNGERESQTEEVYDAGNGATVLLYNPTKSTVILTRQFRLPAFFNGDKTGMLLETCAGLLDDDTPEDCARKEAREETGYHINEVKKVFECYMSPGSVSEMVHFFVAEYTDDMKVSKGGGLDQEHENIEVLEMDFDTACNMIGTGEIKDGKAIMLLQYAKIGGLV
jgi:GDP-mannose pyrophosphatase NudK